MCALCQQLHGSIVELFEMAYCFALSGISLQQNIELADISSAARLDCLYIRLQV